MATILGANTLSSGFDVANSVRFNSADSASMEKNAGTPTDNNKWTFSAWVKRSKLGSLQEILYGDDGSTTNYCTIRFNDTSDTLTFKNRPGSTTSTLTTNAVFRDVAAWYHLVVVLDTSNGTAANRDIIYINGVRETSYSTESHSGDGDACYINFDGDPIKISKGRTGSFFDGYMSEVYFIDGQALAADSFGEFDEDSGIWKPINASGLTFGNNGFYLDFKASGNLGNDANGGTDLTESNLAATDQSTDTCTNNFATLNPLWVSRFDNDGLISKGNCKGTFTAANADRGYLMTTMGVSAGKWYWEAKVIDKTRMYIGIAKESVMAVDEPFYDETTYNALAINKAGEFYGRYTGSAIDQFDTSVSTDNNNILGFALDRDNKALYIHKNGTYINSGDPTSGASRTGCLIDELAASRDLYIPDNEFIFPFLHDPSTSGQLDIEFNFGGSPAFAISSGNADGNGYGNFEYAVPSGYLSLNTKNLAESGG